MRTILSIMICFLLAGCATFTFPKFKFGSNNNTAATNVVKTENEQKNVQTLDDTNKKVNDARNQLELQYAKFREDLQKTYDDAKKKDNENFAEIGALDYGIYVVTQEKKKQDINTLIAHLRAKEIMARTDSLTQDQKDAIVKQVNEEKTKTIDELYTKYNAEVELAISQKADLDKAEMLIEQKEKEKQQLREEQRLTINKLEADQKTQLEQIKKQTADAVEIARANQKAEMIGYIIKALVGVGVLFLVLAILLKNISMGIGSIASFALAYTAATVPMWVIGSVVGVIIVIILWDTHIKKAIQSKKQLTTSLDPKSTANG